VYPRKHIGIHYAKAEARDKPLEVAVAIGLDPTIILAAATRLKLGQDELAFAGALRNEPVKLVQCHTNSVEVPAFAEVILEGKMPPKAREIEGPFGEYTGYYGRAQEMPIMRVDAVTQRRNPIFQATYTGKPPKEEHVITSLCGPEMERPQGWGGTADKAYRLASSVKRHFTEKPIKLPETDVKKTKDRWREYGLE
jgi:UbiD family decarboxylase